MWFTIKRNPALIIQKDGKKNKNGIKSYKNYIYQFNTKETCLWNPWNRSQNPRIPKNKVWIPPTYNDTSFYLLKC